MSNCWPKVWGTNTEIFRNDSVSVNFLSLVKGGVCSWHFHQHKHNTFYLISGKVVIRTEHGETELNPGNSVLVNAPMKHQFEALEDSLMCETMFTKYDPEDIVRLIEGFRREQND
jgi:quercetin dioxygenase-like cupin family protein